MCAHAETCQVGGNAIGRDDTRHYLVCLMFRTSVANRRMPLSAWAGADPIPTTLGVATIQAATAELCGCWLYISYRVLASARRLLVLAAALCVVELAGPVLG